MFKQIEILGLKIQTPLFYAPLAGITDRPYREIIRKCSPNNPILTEMISSHSLIQNRKKGLKTNCCRNFDDYATEGLLGAQIFGADPKIMADAAKIIEQNGAAWIDINMGCPVPKVATRAGAGAFLMQNHALAAEIIYAVSKSVKIPVSIKTRLGWDNQHFNCADLIQLAWQSGAAFATIHGRTRAAGYCGQADWNQIAKIKKQADPKFPIIFNGDIKTESDLKVVQNLGADGAMIGRAMLGNPWIITELATGKIFPQDKKTEMIFEHFEKTLAYYGIKAGIPLFRKHAAWYSAGFKDAAAFRVAINNTNSESEMRSLLKAFFS